MRAPCNVGEGLVDGDALLNETYPLYLECGRQIAPQWRTLEQWAVPSEERATGFKNNVDIEGRTLYRKTA